MNNEEYAVCRLCPRDCGARRGERRGEGVCRMGVWPMVVRAALHFGEEPCLVGTQGSGAVFFCGCPLHCVFCQNGQISGAAPPAGRVLSPAQLREVFLHLRVQGQNINLVTPTHFVPAIARALEEPVGIPVVYNCGGYEPGGGSAHAGGQGANLPARFQIRAVRSGGGLPPMQRITPRRPNRRFWKCSGRSGRMNWTRPGGCKRVCSSGIWCSPGNLDNTKRVIDWVAEQFAPGEVLFSLMSQYTPCRETGFMELQRTLTPEEYDEASEYLFASGIEDGFMQDLSSATAEAIPAFDGTGVEV